MSTRNSQNMSAILSSNLGKTNLKCDIIIWYYLTIHTMITKIFSSDSLYYLFIYFLLSFYTLGI